MSQLSFPFFSIPFQSQAKYDQERAQSCISWIEAVLGKSLDLPGDGCSDQLNFQAVLKDGAVLCE